ncbi:MULTISPECIES: GNAT family N-acetyltransferase [Roseivirga]|uniref:N-acetyltransferase n=1 Tax=Roseivirga thermotolerans TaxID=1758176 RepID=A0ABQ3I652_9BACT|nr:MULTISPECIES: GNAT family N-acetyltransferase [Roseivirga]GHE57956.1 N-acetyltransferase [Roseivirga thermotolerans]|tara:strand:+ start:43783 stop:44244 length:462 start_codon:yes stop_codon:yes gene_type:complete
MKIRKGVKSDLPSVLELIKELAVYEKALHEVEITLEQLEEDGFGEEPVFQFLVATENEQIVGLALYYFRYSTWKGKAIYLEDLVVKESHRGKGYGQKLLDAIVEEARQTGSKQVRWQVLDWNEPAINFYKKLGAHLDGEWINCTLTAKQIANY